MNENTTEQTAVPRKSLARRWILAAVVVAAVGGTGLAAASGLGMHGHGRGHHGPVDAATAAKHIDKMIARILPDGTAVQKARLSEIAKSAFADLQPAKAQLREAHQRAHALLMAPAIDRVALEQLRAEQITRMDAISKRLLSAVQDAAEVLTPEQRVRFAEHMKQRMH